MKLAILLVKVSLATWRKLLSGELGGRMCLSWQPWCLYPGIGYSPYPGYSLYPGIGFCDDDHYHRHEMTLMMIILLVIIDANSDGEEIYI